MDDAENIPMFPLLKRVCVPERPTEPCEHHSGCISITSTFALLRCCVCVA